MLYHLDNHPIKWVRVTGVVVSTDQLPRKRIYVVDDSSGMNIECTAVAPAPLPVLDAPARPSQPKPLASLPAAPGPRAPTRPDSAREKAGHHDAPPSIQRPVVPWEEVEVGSVVKVKGRVSERWNTIQIEAIKVEVMRCSDHEVRCWNEVMAFKRDVLGRPWVVGKQEEEQCRRTKERELRKRKRAGTVAEGAEDRGRRRGRRQALERREEGTTRQNEKGMELVQRPKASSRPSGEYAALGI